jgi:hypothetical protein
LYGLCGLAAILSLALVNPRLEGLALVVFCGAAWIGIQHLGYVELGVAGRMFLDGAFRRQLSSQITLQTLKNGLDQAGTIAESWPLIERASREYGFCEVRLVVQDRTYEFREDAGDLPRWEIRLPLSADAWVELVRPIQDLPVPAAVTPFLEFLSRSLGGKISQSGTHLQSSEDDLSSADWYAKRAAGGRR